MGKALQFETGPDERAIDFLGLYKRRISRAKAHTLYKEDENGG